MKVIYIIWLRQIKRYLRSRSRIIGSLGQPLLFLLALGFGLGPIFQRAGQGNYVNFLVPGVIAMSILFTSIFNGIEIIWDRQFGFLKEMLVAPISRFQIMIGRTLGGATVATIQGLIVFSLSLFTGFKFPNFFSFIFALIFMFLMAILFTGLGIAIASVLTDIHGFQLIVNFLIMPLFFMSGALFPLNDLPPILKTITLLDPLTYGVDGIRGALINIHHLSLSFDFLILSFIAFFILSIGSYLFSKVKI